MRVIVAGLLALVFAMPAIAVAQDKPVPRAADGRPDLSGVWELRKDRPCPRDGANRSPARHPRTTTGAPPESSALHSSSVVRSRTENRNLPQLSAPTSGSTDSPTAVGATRVSTSSSRTASNRQPPDRGIVPRLGLFIVNAAQRVVPRRSSASPTRPARAPHSTLNEFRS